MKQIKRKLLFFLTYYAPHWTGLTQHAVTVSQAMVKRGHKVTVLTTQHDLKLKREEKMQGVWVKRMPVWFRLSRTLIAPALLVWAVKEIARADSVVLYLPFAEVLWVALCAKVLRKKLILVHNGDLVMPKGGWLNRIFESLYFATTALGIWMSDKTVVYTMDYAKHSPLLSKFLMKCQAIFPPILAVKAKSTLVTKLRRSLGSGTPIIGFAGRFVEEKGFDVLIKAIPLVRSRYPQARFVFAGETDIAYERFFDSCKPLIAKYTDALVFLGLLKREDMGSFYELLDVFVLPSRTDCLAFVQVEAMLSGVPVVVSDIPGARVPVKDAGMGILIPKENPHALAKAVVQVVTDSAQYLTKVKRVEKLFSYRASINAFVHAFTN